MIYSALIWVRMWTSAHEPLDQGIICLASKLPNGCRPDNALSRLAPSPGGWVSGTDVVHTGVYTYLTLRLHC